MSTSISGGWVRFADSLHGTDDDPADTVLVRDGVANNLLHAADSMGQVWVTWLPWYEIGGSSKSRGWIRGQDVIDTNNEWFFLYEFGPFPLHVHADGTPYKVRLRVAGQLNTGSNNCYLRVVMSNTSGNDPTDHELAEDWAWESNAMTSTTNNWLGGTTQGSGGYSTYLKPSAAQYAVWKREMSVFNTTSATAEQGRTEVCLVYLKVYAQRTNAASEPDFTGLYAAEYVGK